MKYRKLRIAWTVAWGVACLLLAVLWIESYWRMVVANFQPTQSTSMLFGFCDGEYIFQIVIGREAHLSGIPSNDWIVIDGPELDVIRPSEHSIRSRFTAVFKWFGRSGEWRLIPAWFPVTWSAIFAVAPWLPLRYSLRTLLIGMTVATIGMGWIVYALRG